MYSASEKFMNKFTNITGKLVGTLDYTKNSNDPP